MTKTKISTRDISIKIAAIDDQLLDLLADAERRSYGAVSGSEADIAALAENRRQRDNLEAQRVILDQAKAEATRNEAADREAAEIERGKQLMASSRLFAKKLKIRALKVDAMIADFVELVGELTSIENDLRTTARTAGVVVDGRTGQSGIAHIAVTAMATIQEPEFRRPRPLAETVDIAWLALLGDAE